MKYIVLKGYTNKNLGDDLFLNIIANRYKNKFLILSNMHYNSYGNLIFFSGLKYKIINKIIKLISFKKTTLEKIIIEKANLTILVGGSMFIEEKLKSKRYILSEIKNYCILGSNFGPYKTKEFYNKFYNIFSNALDVCFRDNYSYNLFKDLPNVRYASDIIFSLNTKYLNITNSKKVIISVIDCEKKFESSVKDTYENKIIELINYFSLKEYKIVLMSFCKSEGDEDAIKSILKKIKSKRKMENIEYYFYRGNIVEALNKIADSQIVVGTRFHANILGLIMKKTIIPIAYSDKTINVLKDMNYKGKIFDIRDIENFNIDSLDEKDLFYKYDVSFQKEDSERQFEKLDEIIKSE